jgi:hypothetical protein
MMVNISDGADIALVVDSSETLNLPGTIETN